MRKEKRVVPFFSKATIQESSNWRQTGAEWMWEDLKTNLGRMSKCRKWAIIDYKWSILARADEPAALTALRHKFLHCITCPCMASDGWNLSTHPRARARTRTRMPSASRHSHTNTHNIWVWTCRSVRVCGKWLKVKQLFLVWLHIVVAFCFFKYTLHGCVFAVTLRTCHMTSSYQNWNVLLQGSLTFAQMFVFHMWKETVLWLSAALLKITLKFCQAVKQTLYGSKILHREQGAGGGILAASPSETASTFWVAGSRAELRRRGCK